MTNAKESYEAKILDKLIENSEKLAVNGSELSQVKVEIKNLSDEVKAINSRLTKVEEKIDGVEEKINGVEETIKQINSKQNWFFTILVGIGTGILATLYSQPILNGLSHLR